MPEGRPYTPGERKQNEKKAKAASEATAAAEGMAELQKGNLGEAAAANKDKPKEVKKMADMTDSEVQAMGGLGAAAEMRRRKAKAEAQKAAIMAPAKK